MTAVRLDQSFRRNTKCPCGSSKKIKRCCTHLLQSVDTEDLEREVRNTNGDANYYTRTTDMLRKLDPPDYDDHYVAKMRCGLCHGKGDRPKHRKIIGQPTPERVTCESCDGEGWYLVNVSCPIKVEEDINEETKDEKENKEAN